MKSPTLVGIKRNKNENLEKNWNSNILLDQEASNYAVRIWVFIIIPQAIHFDEWLVKLKYADWSNTNDIKLTYNSADILRKSSNRIVFNIGGNHYRMICKLYFGKTKVHLYIMWIGTHAGCTELFDGDLQYTIKLY